MLVIRPKTNRGTGHNIRGKRSYSWHMDALTHTHTWSYAHYLHKLMPVLYWFAWIGQHGCPVLPPWTLSVTAHATHPYNLVMTNTDTQQGMEASTRETERERERENRVESREGSGMERGSERGYNKARRERETLLVRYRQRESHLSTFSIGKRVQHLRKDTE